MNLQINLDTKTIKLAETVSLKELKEVLVKLLPNDWEEYKLETNTIINNWSYPITIYRDRWPSYPWYPIWQINTAGGNYNSDTLNSFTNSATITTTSSSGTYNLSIN